MHEKNYEQVANFMYAWENYKITNKNWTRKQLASCLIYARAFIEYVCGCVLFQDVTVREIRGR